MEVTDIFLNSEERYDVFCVKSSERPHLLETYSEDITRTSDDELPLTDGCDIPRWRGEGLAPCSPHWEAAMNVGLGCPLLRRESQLPLPTAAINNTPNSPWEILRDFLLRQPATDSIERISCSRVSEIVEEASTGDDGFVRPGKKKFAAFEESNFPVIVTEATSGSRWNLDSWQYDNLVKRFRNVRWRFSDTHGAMMTLETYSKYINSEGMTDDSPLAVYDSEFGDDNSPMHSLVGDYQVPTCFSDDLFALASQEKEGGQSYLPSWACRGYKP